MSLARQFVRKDTDLEARVDPHPDHSDQFRVCLPDALAELPVVDVSAGGVGLQSSVFMPKRLKLVLHVKTQGQSTAEATLRVNAIVRRCELFDYKPTYHVGLQFVDAKGIDEQRLIHMASQANKQNEEAD